MSAGRGRAAGARGRRRSAVPRASQRPIRGSRNRTGRRPSRSHGVLLGIVAGAIVLLVLGGVLVMAVAQKVEQHQPAEPIASVVFDQATANAQSIPMTGALGDQLRRAADEHRSVRLIGIGGDGKVLSNDIFDMTPKLDNGTVLKIAVRAERVTAENLERVGQTINGGGGAEPGQAIFLGLEGLQLDTNEPMYVVSSLLDTRAPLDMRRLGWDVPPQDIIADLKRSGELPALPADVTFIVRPVAGAQEPLRQPQVEYREALWTAIAEASGAAETRFEYVDDGSAPASTEPAPVVPVPPPPTTPVPVDDESGTCVVDASAYFKADSDRLLDEVGTKAALAGCVAQIGSDSAVKVVGHTAGADPDNKFAEELSTKRAQAIAELLESLGVPSGHVEPVGMGNRDQPFPHPLDPRNRCVVVSITHHRAGEVR